MSAVNIPDMSQIVKAHRLNIVPLDISLMSVTPKIENLEHLITDKTRLVVVFVCFMLFLYIKFNLQIIQVLTQVTIAYEERQNTF